VRRRIDDSSIWIGYADFLTTLTVLFFVIAVTFAAKLRSGDGFIVGRIIDETSKGIANCSVIVGDTALGQSSADGTFGVSVNAVQGTVRLGIAAGCAGYDTVPRLYSLSPTDTLSVQLLVRRSRSMTVETLPGDALFGNNSFELRPEAVAMIAELGTRMKAQLSDKDVIAVQGHTDDVPFPAGAGKDNWVLSAERAAQAAKVLTNQVGIAECRVLIMGFGSSRPVRAIDQADPVIVKQEKRKGNRRIEFRQLKGSGLEGVCAN
jgi:flagellar motor protein MotB